MRVAISTVSWKNEDTYLTFKMFKALGFEIVEFNLTPILLYVEKPYNVLKSANDSGLRIEVVDGGWCDFFVRDTSYPVVYKNVQEQIEACRALGASKLRLFFGECPYEYLTKEARKRAADRIRQIGCENPGILFLFENHTSKAAGNFPHLVRNLLMEIDRPNVKACLDVGNYKLEHYDVNHIAEIFGGSELIKHVHVKASPRRFGSLGPPDELELIKFLKDIKYDGVITVESEESNTPMVACMRTKDIVERLINES